MLKHKNLCSKYLKMQDFKSVPNVQFKKNAPSDSYLILRAFDTKMSVWAFCKS